MILSSEIPQKLSPLSIGVFLWGHQLSLLCADTTLLSDLSLKKGEALTNMNGFRETLEPLSISTQSVLTVRKYFLDICNEYSSKLCSRVFKVVLRSSVLPFL